MIFFFLEVCHALGDRKNQHTVWWLEALHHTEQNKNFSSELIKKIEEAISGTPNNSRSSRISSRLVIVLLLYITPFCIKYCDHLSF
jgi:E3 ubiquitin-protein ligase SHPRH